MPRTAPECQLIIPHSSYKYTHDPAVGPDWLIDTASSQITTPCLPVAKKLKFRRLDCIHISTKKYYFYPGGGCCCFLCATDAIATGMCCELRLRDRWHTDPHTTRPFFLFSFLSVVPPPVFVVCVASPVMCGPSGRLYGRGGLSLVSLADGHGYRPPLVSHNVTHD